MSASSERGAGTMLVAGVCLAVASVLFVAAVLIAWFAEVRQAERVAELSALAAVGEAIEGGDPCRAAERVARANESRLTGCRVLGAAPDVVVEAEVSVRLRPALPLGAPAEIARRATAGAR